MPTITLTAPGSETLTGELPAGWHATPLAPYAALATADTFPNRIRAVAALVGLPAQPLLDDVSLYGAIVRAAPWLFGALPEASAPVLDFVHQGVAYAHVGNLDRISAEQMEALYNFLAQAEGKPLTAAPGLLAVLYAPAGQKQTAEVVAAAQVAFATLPVSIAWPALLHFFRAGSSAATLSTTYSALSAQAEGALKTLEQALQASSGSTRFWQKPQRFLLRRWIKSVRATLGTVWS